MCLTGVDYFSTLGYQPGIAFLAAGVLSPVATLVLVLVTLFGALPIYRYRRRKPARRRAASRCSSTSCPLAGKARRARASSGSLATDFVITITLSAADATAHIVENPLVAALDATTGRGDRCSCSPPRRPLPQGLPRSHRARRGPRRRSTSASTSSSSATDSYVVATHPDAVVDAGGRRCSRRTATLMTIAVRALLLFPKLALGLSGFETGVAVMPLVQGEADDAPEQPAGRIGTRAEDARRRRAPHERAAPRSEVRDHDADPAS